MDQEGQIRQRQQAAPASDTSTAEVEARLPQHNTVVITTADIATDPTSPPSRSFGESIWEIIKIYFPMSLLAFGGPQAHVAMFQEVFVQRRKWLPEKTFVELFAIAQALPGPASTQLAYAIGVIRGGLVCGLIAFLVWSLPTMIMMTGFGIGIASLASSLPGWVLAIENGLTSAAVGIVALAAYKLALKICNNPFAIAICTLSGSFAVNLDKYPWAFPCIIAAGAFATLAKYLVIQYNEKEISKKISVHESLAASSNETQKNASDPDDAYYEKLFPIPRKAGLWMLGLWLVNVGIALYLRTVSIKPLNLLGTMVFAGSLIFGGGPVVIPLLQNYVVSSGWLTDQEFLIGLAINNATPGPNFNFASFCGALVLRDTIASSIGGAFIGWVGIFGPGLLIMAAVMPLWQKYRKNKIVQIMFDGANAASVGLVFASVYLLAQKTLVSIYPVPVSPSGQQTTPAFFSITLSPYYMAVAAVTFTNAGYLSIPAPMAMVLGGVLGIFDWLVSGRP